MIVAIVGANGFIGTRTVEMLHLGGGYQVVPVVRRAAAMALCARFALTPRLGNPLDVASLATSLQGCQAVVHVALGDPRQIETMADVLCAAAAAAGVSRVVYLSSAAVFGQAPAPGTDERTPLHAHHAMAYNNAKVRAERRFDEGCARHHLAGFVLRPGVVFGPRSRWIADLANDLRRGRAWLIREGRGICNSLYVDNLVGAIERCLAEPATAAGSYIVGDRDRVTWADLYHGTADDLGIDRRSIHRIAPPEGFRRSPKERIASWVASRPMQAILPAAPKPLKRAGKRLIELLTNPTCQPDAWALPSPAEPRITEELALLQQCEWQLPIARARENLSFEPTVSFETGLRRSLRWLAFAEGRP
jgi:nucleoside-diphosphate-sugar epimerase